MSRFVEDLKVIRDELKRQRDELALQIHLGSAEARDEWEQLEKQWHHFSARADRVLDAVQESSDAIEEDLGVLASDLKEQYKKIKQTID